MPPGDGRQTGSLYAYTGGLLRRGRVRRILELSGYRITTGWPPHGDSAVAVWGRTRPAQRGLWIATRRQANVVTVEDAFLRSVLTGRSGQMPEGLVVDHTGIYFDCSGPSDLENILNHADLGRADLKARAKAGIERLRRAELSKYNAFDPALDVPERDYVLVIDQTAGDASIRLGGADAATFATMLSAARSENPDALILIKTHPEVSGRYRRGHFSGADLDGRTRFIHAPVSPWRLLAGARRVYTVTSLMGFEAILAGHKPRVFGRPFYGGWGLSDDNHRLARRERALDREALFAGAMLLYPTWYDSCRDALCDFETTADNLEAQSRAWREDCHGYAALGIRLWKRRHFRRFFAASGKRLTFEPDAPHALKSRRRGLIWAGRETDAIRTRFADAGVKLFRVEDGFLRSRGLGADLIPPLSLVLDDLGIYFDPGRESRLERILNAGDPGPAALARAARLRARLVASGLSKYNTGGAVDAADWPAEQLKILVPGQVEDDASIQKGAASVRTNAALVARVRADNPEAFVIYKPHPDAEAGLRDGGAMPVDADLVLTGGDAASAIVAADEVWTMTSLTGFEALLRGKPVTCLGVPFYAGWGLTRDLAEMPERRMARPDLDTLVHAVLIAYPRYFDPVSGQACPVEVVVDRLADGTGSIRPGNRALARVQGAFASFAWTWRR
ncbi:MAG: capsular polysaccharide biosynthesis protein [Rhodobacteraceae bacterium]|nr:capsular polysaccharide biosynthesis protein [Paracoccaceae bacterium]